ncbi:MAG: hypothetical protein U0841_09765 [Chloroflexia bacterium]
MTVQDAPGRAFALPQPSTRRLKRAASVPRICGAALKTRVARAGVGDRDRLRAAAPIWTEPKSMLAGFAVAAGAPAATPLPVRVTMLKVPEMLEVKTRVALFWPTLVEGEADRYGAGGTGVSGHAAAVGDDPAGTSRRRGATEGRPAEKVRLAVPVLVIVTGIVPSWRAHGLVAEAQRGRA